MKKAHLLFLSSLSVLGACATMPKAPERGYQVSLEIRVPEKQSYKAGEPFEGGEYTFQYTGKSFEGLILYSVRAHNRGRYGEEDSFLQGVIREGQGSLLNRRFKAFSVGPEKTEMFLDSFSEEGSYSYYLALYDCDSVERQSKKKCFDPTLTFDDIRMLKPLKDVNKTVFVTQRPDCESDKDCVKSCEGCPGGRQHCSPKTSTCVDCDFQVNCKKDYRCQYVQEEYLYKCMKGFSKDYMPAPVKKETTSRTTLEKIQ